ncbi:hypothetical protein LEP1GSC074_3184 [Leptospira noguchii str. Hook]|nr:hypothetical protein LEP1GSC170_4339 [Leptospira interrogans serovar Bataviae str. HAI135]EMS87542.1 hypothetical protein LEP1GSC074_3184 [Leptospira noguchii str. Hook]
MWTRIILYLKDKFSSKLKLHIKLNIGNVYYKMSFHISPIECNAKAIEA